MNGIEELAPPHPFPMMDCKDFNQPCSNFSQACAEINQPCAEIIQPCDEEINKPSAEEIDQPSAEEINQPCHDVKRPCTDVTQSCPEIDPHCAEQQLEDLQKVLTHLKLPLTLDRRNSPRCCQRPQATVVLLAELEEVLNIFLEGNRQSPDTFLYVPTAGWLSRHPIDVKATAGDGDGDGPTDCLHVHMAVTGNASGQTFLDVFSPPRKVTYLDNLLHSSVTKSGVGEGKEVGRYGLDTPASGSLQLNARVDDKLLTTSMCAAVGAHHPITLGLWLAGGDNSGSVSYPENHPALSLLQLCPDNTDLEWRRVEDKVREFTNSPLMLNYTTVVTKPYGPGWCTCKGVTFHKRGDIASIMTAIQALKGRIAPGCGILVQSFHPTFAPRVKTDRVTRRHPEEEAESTAGQRRHETTVRDHQTALRKKKKKKKKQPHSTSQRQRRGKTITGEADLTE